MDKNRSVLYVVLALSLGAAGFSFFMRKPAERSSAVEPAPAAAAAPAKAAPAAAVATPPSPSDRPAEETAILETAEFRVELTSRGAAVRHVRLKGPRYQRGRGAKARPVDIVSTWREEYLPGRIELIGDGPHLPAANDWTIVSRTDREVVFQLTLPEVELVKTVRLGAPYQLRVQTTVANRTAASQSHKYATKLFAYVRDSEQKGGTFRQSPWVTEGICLHGGSLRREDRDDLVEHDAVEAGRIGYAGIDNLYFMMAVAPVRAATDQECRLSAEERGTERAPGVLYQSTVAYATRQLEPGERAEYADRLYFGPKEIETLEAAGAHLDKAVDFGWLSPLCRFLLTILKFFHGLVGNWGVAIILLTISVKLLLLPLTQKSMSSMKDMRRIKPLMDQVNEKFKDDVAKKNQAMMQLYKTHKINPFSGCLPAVAQAPVWIALYQTLWRAVELYRSPFLLWYQDLSAPDAYFVLPLLLGATMFIQQKITPTTMDSMQAKIMLYMMPAMFLVFMLFLPAGLALYSLVNSVLTIVHTQTMYRLNPDLVAAPAPKGNDARGTKPRKPDGRAESTPSGQSRGASKGEGRESRPST